MALKKICLAATIIVSTIIHAQQNDTVYQKAWGRIDSLIVLKNRPQSALLQVDSLYRKSLRQQQKAQTIKCLIYKYSLEDRVMEDDPNKAAQTLQQFIRSTSDPVQKSILNALLAKRLDAYLNMNLWRLYNRTTTIHFVKNDIKTWGANDFHKAITAYFQAALADKSILSGINTSMYHAIMIEGNRSRPSLYHLLAHEALDYFKSVDSYFAKPVQPFTISDSAALFSRHAFTAHRFITKDSSSHDWLALQLYQQLLQTTADKEELLETDIERIEWVHSKAVFSNKEPAYTAALKAIASGEKNLSSSARAWYYLAELEINKASRYQAGMDSSDQYAYVRAKKMIDEALSLVDKTSFWGNDLQTLLLQVIRKELTAQTERVNIPGKPFRALVNFRNIDTLYARIIRVDRQDLPKAFWEQGYWKKMTSLEAYRTFIRVLPATNDYRPHAVEIKIDELPAGSYALLCSSSAQFNDSLNKLSMQFFDVSNISYIRNNRDFFVLDRTTGQPMENVDVTVTGQHIIANIKTDQNGHFKFEEGAPGRNIKYIFSKGKDRLALDQTDFIPYRNDRLGLTTDTEADDLENNNSRIFFFTDRSIYRPGQSVFFKGIAIERNPQARLSRPIIRKDYGWVFLYDMNRKKVDSVRFSLNEYGSFSGQLQVPRQTLTGNFTIQTSWKIYSTASVSVEEYKRPSFFGAFEKLNDSYHLNDSITLNGNATAYAGNSIGGAKVVYTVKRNTRMVNPWLRGIYQPQAREIAYGESATDDNGRFSISFKALADDNVNKNANLIFDFQVSVTITDINGETRSASTTVKLGYASLVLQSIIPEVLPADSFTRIKLQVTNLDGQKRGAKVHIKIYPLQTPQRLVRKRYWETPDLFMMSRQEFETYFPTDEYENESNHLTWKTGGIAAEGTVNTSETDSWQLPSGIFHTGYYKIESTTTDQDGQTIKDTRYIQLFNRTKETYPTASYHFSYTLKGEVQPGDTARFYAATMVDKIYVIRKTERAGKTNGVFNYAIRGKGFETIELIATEADRGGACISEAFVYDNRFYVSQYNANIPWSNKQLDISYVSYRNKTEPGSREQWTLHIKGDKGQEQATELLTGMYDASLDQFRPHHWSIPYIWESSNARNEFIAPGNFNAADVNQNYLTEPYSNYSYLTYDHLPTNADELWERFVVRWDNASASPVAVRSKPKPEALNDVVITGRGNIKKDAVMHYAAPGIISNDETKASLVNPGSDSFGGQPQKIRTDFNETAFFFPHLYADSLGNYSFSFSIPEALTTWKWMSLAHTKDLAFGAGTQTVVTQKTLMVQPNMPRFLREGDQIELSTRIANLGEKELTGQVSLELVDAFTGTSVDGWFQNVFPVQYFTAEAGKSTAIKFPVQIPFSYNKPLTWRIVAKAGNYSDGEENTLPVVTNRILVTESLPLYMQKDTTRSFRFEKLLNTSSETLTQEGLTVEYSTSPVWYAVKALPYLIEYPYECAEQTFNRVYANALASYILQKNLVIRQVLGRWMTDTSSLKTNLQKNQSLKQLLLEETPWVLDAANETEQLKNIALLLDLSRLDRQADQFIDKLQQLQLPGGGFAWFKGGYEDRYISNYILTGAGKLKRLGALNPAISTRLKPIIIKALQWLDGRVAADYKYIVENKIALKNSWQLSSTQVQYLYMRSFFSDIPQQSPEAYRYFYNMGKLHWARLNQYNQAMLGLVYYRNNDKKFVNNNILPAVMENTIEDKEQGSIYWKERQTCFWYNSPVEHQSMMIDFLQEMQQDQPAKQILAMINKARTWLLLNKQTNNWKTTVATADACHALLQSGSNWLSTGTKLSIKLGNQVIDNTTEKQDAGSGYFTKRIEGRSVTPAMGRISVSISSNRSANEQSPGWGSIYWQYFEEMNKVTPAATPLTLSRKLFVERNSDKGKVLDPIKEGEELKPGDKLIVRIELKSDRDMEYLHLKDVRAAAMEPVNVLSGYQWQDGLGYYESTRDASTNFFISYLKKGAYVFEYPTFVTQTGLFLGGIATVQCMYAPGFSSHSEGFNIRVGK